jgi:hypothetical protein
MKSSLSFLLSLYCFAVIEFAAELVVNLSMNQVVNISGISTKRNKLTFMVLVTKVDGRRHCIS